MVLPDGARAKRIPTLSWDSVVDTADRPVGGADQDHDVLASDTDVVTLAPLSLDLSAPVDTDEPDDEPGSESLHLDAPTTFSAPVPAPPLAPYPAELSSPPAADELVAIRTTPPAVIVPAIGDVTSGPDEIASIAAPAVLAPDPVTDALPEIQEATPVEPTSPLLPSIPAPQTRPAVVAPFEFDPGSVAPAPAPQPRRRKKRGGIKLVATFVVLGGLVVAGVVFGQAYLFPGEWDAATAPYADAVEAASGVEFAEPLSIVAEPTVDFATRMQAQFASVLPEEMAQWRALGLATGTVDDATLAQQLAGWQDAVYSTLDGQVYDDSGVVGPELDAQLTQEMAAASLDQQFGWSVGQPDRTLDAAAATSAEVLRQARAIQQASTFAGPVPPVPTENVDAMPPVIGYQMLAPQVFAEFGGAVAAPDGSNSLAGLGTSGPGTVAGDATTMATGPVMLEGDVATAAPVAMDRSFWYLVFAGYVDTRTAYAASEAVVENSLTTATRGTTHCVSATFAGGDVDQTAMLRWTLTAWASAAPAEMASSFQVLPDGALQLVSCDPGAGFDPLVRPGVARELLSWRMAALATAEAVRSGGGEADLASAWAFVQASPVAEGLIALPASATPAEMATAAREAVGALFATLG